jgi:hypothetical protein
VLLETTASPAGPPPASIGNQTDRSVPSELLDLAFSDLHRDVVTLGSFVGWAVFGALPHLASKAAIVQAFVAVSWPPH